MGSPYLNSGETLVLTTNRVSVSAVPYNIMLTTERIFLIEEGSTLFEPRILPLTMLLSVRSGTTPSSDPVILLLFRTEGGDGGQQPVNLVFSQGRNENRQPERDDWVRNLIQLSISRDETVRPAEIPAVPKVTGGIGLRPMARHGVAPERVRPLSNVRSRQPVPSPVTEIPDEAMTGGETPAAAMPAPAGDSGPVPATAPEEPAPGRTPYCGTLPSLPDQVINPQVIEDLVPEKTAGSQTAVEEPAPSPVTVIPDGAVTGGETPATAMPTPAGDSGPVSATAPEEPVSGPAPGCGTLPSLPDQVINPQVIEDLVPEKTAGSQTAVEEPAPSHVMIIPDGAVTGKENPAAAIPTPAGDSGPVPATAPEEPAPGLTPGLGTRPSPPARVIIPQIIEELLPVRTADSPTPVEEPASSADFDHEALLRAISRAVRSMKVTEEKVPQPYGSPECGPVPETAPQMVDLPVPGTVPVPEAGGPVPAAAGREEVPDIIRALYTGTRETNAPEPAGPPAADVPEPAAVTATDAPEPAPSPAADVPEPAAVAEPVPEPAALTPQAGIAIPPESHETLTILQDAMQDSATHPAPEELYRREPAAAKAAPVRHPIPPAREIHPIRTTLKYAAVLLVVIALIAGGVILLHPQQPLPADIPAGPSPGTAPSATLLPETVQPADIAPAVSAITTPVPFLPESPVPQTGVWVRVNSSVYYFGTVGNPELVQQISGTGDNSYKILRSDRPVQVSVQKQDNSGALLGVGIYRDGALISTRSVTSPMGSVDLLIDPLTARAPGLTENDTHAEHAAPPTGLENY